MSALRDRLQSIAAAFVDELVDALESARAEDWVDQKNSPLGRDRHLALARCGALPSSKDQRRVLIRRKDIDTFLAKKKTVRVDERQAAIDEERAVARAVAELTRKSA